MSSFDRFTADDKAVPIAAEEDGRGGVTTPTAPALLDRFLLFLVATEAAVVVFGSVGECSWWHDEGDFIVLL